MVNAIPPPPLSSFVFVFPSCLVVFRLSNRESAGSGLTILTLTNPNPWSEHATAESIRENCKKMLNFPTKRSVSTLQQLGLAPVVQRHRTIWPFIACCADMHKINHALLSPSDTSDLHSYTFSICTAAGLAVGACKGPSSSASPSSSHAP